MYCEVIATDSDNGPLPYCCSCNVVRATRFLSTSIIGAHIIASLHHSLDFVNLSVFSALLLSLFFTLFASWCTMGVLVYTNMLSVCTAPFIVVYAGSFGVSISFPLTVPPLERDVKEARVEVKKTQ